MIIDKKELYKIDLFDLSSSIIEEEFKNYFLQQPGKEHYPLLSYISNQYNNAILLDIGTYKGCSALALSYNKSNKVMSFDISDNLLKLKNYPKNIEFIIDDILQDKYKLKILESPFIILDTYHDGIFEKKFFDYLISIKWNGLLLLDDIHLNNEMKNFWESIQHKKEDVSNIGHHSGTGFIYF